MSIDTTKTKTSPELSKASLDSSAKRIDDLALALHATFPAGKTGTLVTKPLTSVQDLTLVYSPGVAAPVMAIVNNPAEADRLTSRGNRVAVVTNGTAVLGLGNVGPVAAIPVMEGKAALLKQLGGIDGVNIELAASDPDQMVAHVQALAPGFAGILLEDISSPECFHIEQALQQSLDIPVFHDDQHGTAVSVVAAVIGALARQGKSLAQARIVFCGAGAAALGSARLLLTRGVQPSQIILCDVVGPLTVARHDLDSWQRPFATERDISSIEEALNEADVLIGLSVAGAIRPDMLIGMAQKPVVLVLANPEPEIAPETVMAHRPDAIVGTGRSDYPNQVNNLLAFPYLFRGALDVGARRISDGMLNAAVDALLSLAEDDRLLPWPLDPRLRAKVSGAVADAARAEGLAQRDHAAEIRAEPPTRLEQDSLGPVRIPFEKLYGAQTQRALLNFPLSGTPIGRMPALIRNLARVKKAAAMTNLAVGEIEHPLASAIINACDEIIAGQWHDQFVVDVFQGGAGTSSNMNANEVIANRALELIGANRGDYHRLSPNDHVNRSQSTNDAYATAVRLTVFDQNERLVAALGRLEHAMAAKSQEFEHIAKLGRTQLQDAVPMTLGQEFGAFAATIAEDIARASELATLFLEVNLGGTAIGTGIGASEAYRQRISSHLAEVTVLPVKNAANLVEASWDMGAFVLYSGMLKRVASKLSKVANDLRLLSSGPQGGIGEIALPDRQPGSSLMPGKVNPVIPEAVNQVAFRVFGLDLSITFAAEGGQLQLNAFEPLILWSLHEAVDLLVAACDMLIDNCVKEIEACEARCASNLGNSTALATALVPLIGYARSAAVAQLAKDAGSLRSALEILEPAYLGIIDGKAASCDDRQMIATSNQVK